MWFIGVEVEQETSAPPPKKILDPPLLLLRSEKVFSFHNSKTRGLPAYFLFMCLATIQ